MTDHPSQFKAIPEKPIDIKPQIDIASAYKIRAAGVRCPRCSCGHCPVLYTRHYREQSVRRRKCGGCGHEFRTSEEIVHKGDAET